MRPHARLLVGLFLAALLASGCGSSAPATPAPAPAAQAPAPVAPTAPPATPTRPPATPTAVAPDFASILRAAPSTFKVTYTLRTTTSGQPPFTGAAAMYVKPPKTRFDTVTKMDGRDMPASVFMLEDGNYICADMSGQRSCLRMPKGSSQEDPALSLQQGLRERPEDYIVESKGTRQLAGMTAYCFTVRKRSGAAGDPSETCYSSDGIPLGIYTKSGTTQTEMEATAVSRTVADDDFRLPAPPMDMPAIPAMPGMPQGMPGMPQGMPTMPAGKPAIPGIPTAPSR